MPPRHAPWHQHSTRCRRMPWRAGKTPARTRAQGTKRLSAQPTVMMRLVARPPGLTRRRRARVGMARRPLGCHPRSTSDAQPGRCPHRRRRQRARPAPSRRHTASPPPPNWTAPSGAASSARTSPGTWTAHGRTASTSRPSPAEDIASMSIACRRDPRAPLSVAAPGRDGGPWCAFSSTGRGTRAACHDTVHGGM